jgi:flagellar biosynthesis/type III secretory pathway M-ring protein FliF/YscJ
MAIEVALLLVIGVIAVACARPLFLAYSKKMEAQYKGMEPQQVQDFKARLGDLEEQVRELKKHCANAQESADFAMKLLQEHELNSDSSQKLNLSEENKQKLRSK